MFAKESLEQLTSRLQAVDAEIAAHPLASEKVKQAHAIVEARGETDKAEVDRQLTASGLPSLEELGKIQVKGTASWWALHRDKKKIEAKIEKLAGS